MSKRTNDLILKHLESVEKRKRIDAQRAASLRVTEPVRQTFLVQKYLQNPFSLTWSKLATLFQSTQDFNNQPEALEED